MSSHPRRPLRVLLVSSELESFARTGGLGDAVEGLGRALARLGADVLIVSPRYGVTGVPGSARWWAATVPARVGWGPHDERHLGVLEVTLESAGRGRARVCLLDEPTLFGARFGIYGDAFGPFGDNALRFATLCRGALSVAERVWGPVQAEGVEGQGPDVLHGHDWHGALAILYPRLVMGPRWRDLPTVLNIHNVAFQGVFGREQVDLLGLPGDAFESGVLEHGGALNLLKGAAVLADRVITVSRTYAREILTPEQGHGLDGIFRDRGPRFLGIENGIDVDAFDPARDGALTAPFDGASAPLQRGVNGDALRDELGLARDGSILFGSVTRLSWQKGMDVLLDVVPPLVERGAQFVLVGTGESDLEARLRAIASRYPGRVAARVAFDARLARRVYGGADAFVVPSRYEPCGLTQLYAMRYGAIPVVTPVGGLKDTVTPLRAGSGPGAGTGFVASEVSADAVQRACVEALETHRNPAVWRGLVARAMARDSSWRRPAEEYLAHYEDLVGAQK